MQKRLLTKWIMLGFFAGFSGSAMASGFQLFEANGAGLGNFYAGGAAEADDASTAYFNPAGLVRLNHPQVVLSAVGIFSDMDFTGKDTWSSPSAGRFSQTGTAHGGTSNLVPGFNFAMPINNEFYAGFSAGAPFGLSTNYGNSSFLRYSGTETSLQVIDLSPVIAFKITDKLSLGAGPDFDYVEADFNSISGLPTYAIAHGYPSTAYDTQSKNHATDWGHGWHAGALYQFTPCTRAGLTYRSKVSFSASGTSEFTGPLAGGPVTLRSPVSSQYKNNDFRADTTLPASTMLSVYHEINPVWAVMASTAYTEWSVFNHLTLQNVAAVNSLLAPQAINVSVPEDFHNTWRFAAGVSYQPMQDWKFRAGLGYDQNPTTPEHRNIRLPDGNRTAASIGAHYQATKMLGIDAGWTHLFFQKALVSTFQVSGTQTTTTLGEAKTSADLLGLQLTLDFA